MVLLRLQTIFIITANLYNIIKLSEAKETLDIMKLDDNIGYHYHQTPYSL